jgi:bifunctional isochorismate lyase/aryl carrier protein
MKEKFYTVDNIGAKAAEFMQRLQPLREMRQHMKLQPQKAALLVIDMQKFFYQKTSHAFIPSMATIVPKLKQLQDCCLRNKLPVIQTKHGNTQEDAKAMGRWWGGSILRAGDPLSELIPELCDDKISVILKTQYDAFWETDLEEKLKKQNVEQVVISGIMTHLCCETTAREAYVRGFDVFFTVDGTTTYNSEFHFNSLMNLAHGFAVPMLCQEVMDIINGS